MADVTLKVMVIVPHYWGKGDTVKEAWQRVKKESYSNLRDLKRGKWKVFTVTDTEEVKSGVNEYGQIRFPKGHPPKLIDEKE